MLVLSRFLALVCIVSLLLVAFVAPLHTHSGGHDGGCVLCHATERATAIAIDTNAGKPLDTAQCEFTACEDSANLPDRSILRSGPRAPPSMLLVA
jgi:hypothetical protein